MKPKVKFCGMRRREDIEFAESLGIDFLGFVFVSSSPRSITPQEVAALRGGISHAKVVGVFVDPTLEILEEAISLAKLDYVQIYGTVPAGNIGVPVIRAFRGVPSPETLEQAAQRFAYLLIDKIEGRDSLNLQDLEVVPQEILAKTFIAGGLDAKNLKRAMNFQPFALDTARGIESSPGMKDPVRMKEFLSTLHS